MAGVIVCGDGAKASSDFSPQIAFEAIGGDPQEDVPFSPSDHNRSPCVFVYDDATKNVFEYKGGHCLNPRALHQQLGKVPFPFGRRGHLPHIPLLIGWEIDSTKGGHVGPRLPPLNLPIHKYGHSEVHRDFPRWRSPRVEYPELEQDKMLLEFEATPDDGRVGPKLKFGSLPALAKVFHNEEQSSASNKRLRYSRDEHQKGPTFHPLLGFKVLLACLGFLTGGGLVVNAFHQASTREGNTGLLYLMLGLCLMASAGFYASTFLVSG